MRRLAAWLAVALLLALAWTAGPARAADAASNEKDCPAVGNKVPVILVHGWNSGKTVWQSGGFSQALSRLSGVFVDDQFDYQSDNDQWVTKDSIGPALARRVMHLARCSTEQRGPGKVVLVGHSMGGLAIRCAANPACGKVDGVADKIALVVTMGTPNLGAWIRGDKLTSSAEQILLDELKAGCQGRRVLSAPGAFLGATASLLPICPLIGEAGGPAGQAFTEGSDELKKLPWLPDNVPTLALAAHKRLTVSLFTKTYTLNEDVGDMVVNENSAQQDVREIGSLGGKVVIDCGTYDFTLLGMFSTCWHGSEVSNSEFQGHVFDEIEKLTRSLGLASVTAADLRNAPVPPLCTHPGGRLVHGALPGLDVSQGYEFILAPGTKGLGVGGRYTRPVMSDLTGDGAGEAVAVLQCSAGGVSWPDTVLVYGPGPRLLGALDLFKLAPVKLAPVEHAGVSSLKLEKGGVRVSFETYQGCCYLRASWSVHFKVHGDQLVLGPLVSESKCPQAPTLYAATKKTLPTEVVNDVTKIQCSGDWAVAWVEYGIDGGGVTKVFKLAAGQWTAVDPADHCTGNEIPAALRNYACGIGE